MKTNVFLAAMMLLWFGCRTDGGDASEELSNAEQQALDAGHPAIGGSGSINTGGGLGSGF